MNYIALAHLLKKLFCVDMDIGFGMFISRTTYEIFINPVILPEHPANTVNILPMYEPDYCRTGLACPYTNATIDATYKQVNVRRFMIMCAVALDNAIGSLENLHLLRGRETSHVAEQDHKVIVEAYEVILGFKTKITVDEVRQAIVDIARVMNYVLMDDVVFKTVFAHGELVEGIHNNALAYFRYILRNEEGAYNLGLLEHQYLLDPKVRMKWMQENGIVTKAAVAPTVIAAAAAPIAEEEVWGYDDVPSAEEREAILDKIMKILFRYIDDIMLTVRIRDTLANSWISPRFASISREMIQSLRVPPTEMRDVLLMLPEVKIAQQREWYLREQQVLTVYKQLQTDAEVARQIQDGYHGEIIPARAPVPAPAPAPEQAAAPVLSSRIERNLRILEEDRRRFQSSHR